MTELGEIFSIDSLKDFLNIKLVSTVLTVLVLYIVAKVTVKILRNTIFKYNRLEPSISKTLENLTVRIVNVVLFIVGLFTVLDALGVNTASLVATAGVGSIAIGFGAQSIVKDLIAGAFILIEGQYFVGDDVVIEGISGRVVELGLRSTKIKDVDKGAIHYIANGNIKTVENRSQDDQYSVVKIDIPEEYDIGKLFEDVREALASLEDDERVLEGPELFGIVESPERYNRLFMRATVTNGATYAISREIRRAVFDHLAEKGYVINSPIIVRDDKEEKNALL